MTDAELADEIERALNVLQPLAHGDILFSAPNAAPGCELRFSMLREAVAALRRQETLKVAYFEGYEDAMKDRQPSSDQVLMPRDVGELAQDMVATMKRQPGYNLAITHGRILKIAQEICRLYELSKLSAAEAEGRET